MYFHDSPTTINNTNPSPEIVNLFWDDQLNQRLYLIFLYFSNSLSAEEFDLVASSDDNNSNENGKKNDAINIKLPFYEKHYHQIVQYSNVTLSPNSAYFLINRIFRLINPTKAESIEFPDEYAYEDNITFEVYIYLIRMFFHDRVSLEPAVDKVYERFVIQIIFKGFVLCEKYKRKYGCLPINLFPPNPKVYWCTILPGSIFLWELSKNPSPAKRHLIRLTMKTEVPETSFFKEDRFEFCLKTLNDSSSTTYNFAHFDELCIKKIIESIQLSIECNNRDELTKFDMNHASLTECKRQKNKLMTWKAALEMENERLTKVLIEERGKLRDEEIVRAMTTRMLFDEQDKVELLKKEVIELRKIIDCQGYDDGDEFELTNVSLKKKKKRFFKKKCKKNNYKKNKYIRNEITSDLEEGGYGDIINEVPCKEFSGDFIMDTDTIDSLNIGPRVKEINGFFNVIKCKFTPSPEYFCTIKSSNDVDPFLKHIQITTEKDMGHWFLKLDESTNMFQNFEHKTIMNSRINKQLKFIIWTDPFDININNESVNYPVLLESFKYYTNVSFISVPIKFFNANFPSNLDILELTISTKKITPQLSNFFLNIEKGKLIPCHGGVPFKHLFIVKKHFLDNPSTIYIFFDNIEYVRGYYDCEVVSLKTIYHLQGNSLTTKQFNCVKYLFTTKLEYPFF
uniref:ULP_PROTEASE domain-containing protein n=1 Tax=Parastrongyloides trichosuri TaxID=131310 RepID=A0A0N4ZP20_PARTI